MGRVEFDTIEEGREEEILVRAARSAVLEVFRTRLSGFDFSGVLGRFSGEQTFAAETSDVMTAAAFLDQFGDVPGLAGLLQRLGVEAESQGVAASGLEFALEGLHLSRRLNKDQAAGGESRYRAPAVGE